MGEETLSFLGKQDARIAEYPLMKNMKATILLSLLYLLFVKVLGPYWMRHRRPFQLRIFMVVYNLSLVALSAFIFLNIALRGWFSKYSWRCEPIDESNDPTALKMVQVMWVYYASKLLEFADTVFFVLRKKDAQISKLHLIHHSTLPLLTWISISYGPGGYNTIAPMTNSFVHIWMYLYYGLSALGPTVQKFLWWKKYITTIQLVQFVFICGFYGQLYFFHPQDCEVSGLLVCNSVIPSVAFFVLFAEFYYNSYKKKSTSKNPKVKICTHNGSCDSCSQRKRDF